MFLSEGKRERRNINEPYEQKVPFKDYSTNYSSYSTYYSSTVSIHPALLLLMVLYITIKNPTNRRDFTEKQGKDICYVGSFLRSVHVVCINFSQSRAEQGKKRRIFIPFIYNHGGN